MLPCFKHNQIKSTKSNPIAGGFATGFITSNIIKSIVQRRTRYEPDRRVLFYYVGNVACDISGITTKAPCKAARMSVRHVRIEISDFALRTFLPFFSITQYLPRSLVEKRFLSLLFSKKINQSLFPFAVCRKLSRSFCSWFHIIPCIFFLFVLE